MTDAVDTLSASIEVVFLGVLGVLVVTAFPFLVAFAIVVALIERRIRYEFLRFNYPADAPDRG
jgi:hypothetical protein